MIRCYHLTLVGYLSGTSYPKWTDLSSQQFLGYSGQGLWTTPSSLQSFAVFGIDRIGLTIPSLPDYGSNTFTYSSFRTGSAYSSQIASSTSFALDTGINSFFPTQTNLSSISYGIGTGSSFTSFPSPLPYPFPTPIPYPWPDPWPKPIPYPWPKPKTDPLPEPQGPPEVLPQSPNELPLYDTFVLATRDGIVKIALDGTYEILVPNKGNQWLDVEVYNEEIYVNWQKDLDNIFLDYIKDLLDFFNRKSDQSFCTLDADIHRYTFCYN